MHLRDLAIVTAALGLASPPAHACSVDPFLFQLPGETDADARQRSDDIRSDHRITARFAREKYAVEKAARIYLARVISKTRGNYAADVLPSTKVRAIAPLKGTLPSQDQPLTDQSSSGGCWDVGDGYGAFGEEGALFVVFDGLPKDERRPRGIDSIHVQHIRTVPLLDQLRELGRDLE